MPKFIYFFSEVLPAAPRYTPWPRHSLASKQKGNALLAASKGFIGVRPTGVGYGNSYRISNTHGRQSADAMLPRFLSAA